MTKTLEVPVPETTDLTYVIGVNIHYAEKRGAMEAFIAFTDKLAAQGWTVEIKNATSGKSPYCNATTERDGYTIELAIFGPEFPDALVPKLTPDEVSVLIESTIAHDRSMEGDDGR